ncbi:hypothetical protein EVAR_9255_1 [Eumeta japonica]|uniref:Uncharacterized protein n=1 Tax=Eumeta variegata TaxID=151549 RepID=A0A4C1TLK5_EUMVA|nr:hypothetical protein EVAR_9255_1 [Eumeta japonica]
MESLAFKLPPLILYDSRSYSKNLSNSLLHSLEEKRDGAHLTQNHIIELQVFCMESGLLRRSTFHRRLLREFNRVIDPAKWRVARGGRHQRARGRRAMTIVTWMLA